MKPALNPVTLKPGLDLPTFIEISARAGFQGVEFSMDEAARYAEQKSVQALRDLFQRKGVSPAQWMFGAPFMAPDGEFEGALCRLAPTLSVAQQLEARTAMVVLPFRTALPIAQARATLIHQLKRSARLCADHGIRLALEFIGLRFQSPGETDFIIDLRQTLDLIHEIDEPNVGVMIDLFHFYTGGSEISDLRSMSGSLLYMIHLDDAPAGDPGTLTDSMRVLPGRGVIGVKDVLRECAQLGYKGFASLELFGEELRSMDPLEAARLGYEATMEVLPAS